MKRKKSAPVKFGASSSNRSKKHSNSTSSYEQHGKKTMNSEPYTVEKTINRMLIVDQVAQLLYATGVVPHNDNITNIQFSNLFGESTDEFTNIKIFIKPQEVKGTQTTVH